jgi:hypothetical protein
LLFSFKIILKGSRISKDGVKNLISHTKNLKGFTITDAPTELVQKLIGALEDHIKAKYDNWQDRLEDLHQLGDSDNPEVGLNYYRGPPQWQWVRSQGGQKVITREMLIDLLLSDSSYDDFKSNPITKDLPNSETTVRTLIEKYIFDERGNPVLGIRQAKIELVRSLLKEAISKGLDRDGVLEYFSDHGATILQKRSLSDRRYAGIDTFCKQSLKKSFDKSREEFYIQPLIYSLVRRGAYIPGLGSQRVNIENFPDLIDDLRRTKHRIGSGNDLGLIEILMVEGVQGRELTKALGLWQDGDSETVKQRADNDLMIYIRHRWGFDFKSEAQLREYLFILYLTRSW